LVSKLGAKLKINTKMFLKLNVVKEKGKVENHTHHLKMVKKLLGCELN